MSQSRLDQSKEYFIAYSILIDAAQHHGFATYQEIAQAVGLPTVGSYMGSQIGQLLGLISANEKKQGRPMLSAICVGANGKPGEGFLSYAKELGYLKDGNDEQAFWKSECERIYEEWKISYRKSLTKDS